MMFQVHLWTGLALGVYALITGVTGSILVFQPELEARTLPLFYSIPSSDRPLADPAVVIRKLEAAYPGHRLSSINWPSPQRHSFVAYPSRHGEVKTVFAHPYSGDVLGELPEAGWLFWTRELHVYLLGGRTGLKANGIASGVLVFVGLTGLIVWWPGLLRWTRALLIDINRGWRRIIFDLHSAVGFWTAAVVLLWAFSGVYLTFAPEFRDAVSAVSPLTVRTNLPRSDMPPAAVAPPAPATLVSRALAAVPGAHPERYERALRERDPIVVLVALDVPGDRISADESSIYFDQYSGALLAIRAERGTTAGDLLMAWLFPLHAGWFGGMPIKIVWALLGLSLPLMFVTGTIMWWNRVIARRL
jgi:uncharacterized iron-regulated membrane protein